MTLVQITKRRGSVDRVKFGEQPMVELELDDNQTVVGFEMHESIVPSTRKTTDYWWIAWVATRL